MERYESLRHDVSGALLASGAAVMAHAERRRRTWRDWRAWDARRRLSAELLCGVPAPGGRHSSYGTLYTAGQGGCSWASEVSGSYARNLSFDFSGINPQTSYYRSNARQVRCLLE